jgi:hypothetical protein
MARSMIGRRGATLRIIRTAESDEELGRRRSMLWRTQYI